MSKELDTLMFEWQRIFIWRGRRGELPKKCEIEALVAIGVGMACHPVPVGTALHRCFPDAWQVSNTSSGGCITTFPLPADEETARALMAFLHEHRSSQLSQPALIQRCVGQGGQWIFHPSAEGGKDGHGQPTAVIPVALGEKN
jgi:hypothetical protein